MRSSPKGPGSQRPVRSSVSALLAVLKGFVPSSAVAAIAQPVGGGGGDVVIVSDAKPLVVLPQPPIAMNVATPAVASKVMREA
jgi:hypothetical protein